MRARQRDRERQRKRDTEERQRQRKYHAHLPPTYFTHFDEKGYGPFATGQVQTRLEPSV